MLEKQVPNLLHLLGNIPILLHYWTVLTTSLNEPWLFCFSQESKVTTCKTARHTCPRGLHGQDTLKCPQHSKWFSNVLSSCTLLFNLHVFICNAYQKFGRFCKQNSKIKTREQFIWITTFIDWKWAWKGEYIGKQFLERGNCAQKEKSILMAMWTRHPLFPNSVITHRSSVFLPTPCFLRRMTGRITSFEMADDKAWWSTDNSDCSLRFNP
jgi:hypothetical protein